MADLKAGTTIGGTLVWTQGNFPLYPTGNTLLYKNFKVYSENDKPQAADNDFVSKAQGGSFYGQVFLENSAGLRITNPNVGYATNGFFKPGLGDDASFTKTNIEIQSHWGIGFRSTLSDMPITAVIDTRTGYIGTISTVQAKNLVANDGPTDASHVTRKDYVDNQINTVNNNANTKVSKSGDTMTGSLAAPYFISLQAATTGAQVPRLDQVVARGIILDYGTF